MQIYQYSPKCQVRPDGYVFRYMEKGVNSPIASKFRGDGYRGGVIEQVVYSALLEKIDHSVEYRYFGLIYRIVHVFYSIWTSLDYYGQEHHFSGHYYNSINALNFISPASRVIDRLRCNIRLINRSKYEFEGGGGSVFTSIQAFSRLQAARNEYVHQLFDTWLNPGQSALASGTLIGSQSTIEKDLKEDLISAGLIHVIVASGYNLMIMSTLVSSLLSIIFPKKIVGVISLVIIWWYAFLALFSPSIVRAAWMCSVSILVNIVGRPKSVWRTMTISILLLLAFQPILLGSISFQLSVFSTIGVLLVAPAEQRNEPSTFVQKVLALFKENCQTTLGANLLTFPIIIFWFKRISIISIVSNTVLLWSIPLLMYCSSIFVVSIHIHPWLGIITLVPIKILTNFFLAGTHFFARFPWASIELRYISLSETVLLYIGISVIWYLRRKFKKRMELVGQRELSKK